MDLSLFWMMLIMPTIIYVGIASQTDNSPYFGRNMFFGIAGLAIVVIAYFAYNMARQGQYSAGITVGIIGTAISTLLGFLLFAKLIDDKKKRDAENELERVRFSNLTPEQRAAEKKTAHLEKLSFIYGDIVPALVCQHCRKKGKVRRRSALSSDVALDKSHTYKQREITKLHCDNCSTDWNV
jgi:hypothetical protein